MDKIPLYTPVCLQSFSKNNLQNNFISNYARCENQNTQTSEQMFFLKTEDDKIIIQSRWDKRSLQVRKNGNCVFDNFEKKLCEFDVEWDKDGFVYFISCDTGNVMHCDEHGAVSCKNKNLLGWDAWKIIPIKYPTIKYLGLHFTLSFALYFGFGVSLVNADRVKEVVKLFSSSFFLLAYESLLSTSILLFTALIAGWFAHFLISQYDKNPYSQQLKKVNELKSIK